jgi:hypothetical protein
MKREVLNQPFSKHLIRTRKGPFGQTFSYVQGCEYIRRLNESFEGEWSFEVLEHQLRDNEAIVLGRLTVGGIVKTAFGSSTITISRDGEVVSIGDDLKAAATDALKKAASLLGVGLHLYSSDQPREQAASGRHTPAGNGTNGQRNGNGHRPGNGNSQNSGNRLTQKQLSAIWSMGRNLGEGAEQIRQRTRDAFGVEPEYLSKQDASAFITELGQALSGPGQ